MLADKTFHYSYSQIDEHKPTEFCSLALKNSLRLDLGLGYFSSASFHVLANGMAQFIVNGGKMNLYINQYQKRTMVFLRESMITILTKGWQALCWKCRRLLVREMSIFSNALHI